MQKKQGQNEQRNTTKGGKDKAAKDEYENLSNDDLVKLIHKLEAEEKQLLGKVSEVRLKNKELKKILVEDLGLVLPEHQDKPFKSNQPQESVREVHIIKPQAAEKKTQPEKKQRYVLKVEAGAPVQATKTEELPAAKQQSKPHSVTKHLVPKWFTEATANEKVNLAKKALLEAYITNHSETIARAVEEHEASNEEHELDKVIESCKNRLERLSIMQPVAVMEADKTE